MERPELLSTKPMRDFVIGARDRDRWIPLGKHYAPGFLMGCYRKVICDVYGMREPNKTPPTGDIPPEMQMLNERFFTASHFGLSADTALYQSEILSTLEYPTLWRVDGKSFYDMHKGRTCGHFSLADYYWAHPHQRLNFERIVIVPRGA